MSRSEKGHIISGFSFELSHCDDPDAYEKMFVHLNEIDSELAHEVARNVGGKVPDKPAPSNHGKTSQGLSQRDFLPKEPTIKSRRIAILIADEVNAAEVEGLRAAIKMAGATAWLIGPRRGTIYGARQSTEHDAPELMADHHFEGQRSTLFDAIIVPSGEDHVKTLAGCGRVVHWVREAFGHLKAIGAIGEGEFCF